MRKLMVWAALALLPTVASAQETPRSAERGMRAMNTVSWLLESKAEYQATNEQTVKIQEINKKFEAETAQLRADMQKIREEAMGSGDRQGTMQKLRPLREQMRTRDEAAVAEVMKLLTPEQQKKVNELMAKRREEMRNRMRDRRPGR